MTDKEFYKFVRRFNIIKRMLGLVRDDNRKIQLIEELARNLTYKTRGIYADEYLEKLLCNIGSKIEVDLKDSPHEGTVLHIISMASIIGGHTRVIDHWIQLDSEREHSIVLTLGAAARLVFPQFLKDTVESSGGQVFFLRSASHISRAKQLLELAQKYDKIILHTFMEDAIPTLAFSNKKWKRTIYLFNHANFRFWLGTSIADVCLDITNQDADVSRRLRGIENVRVLPIPMLDTSGSTNMESIVREKIRQYFGITERNKVVTTMADPYKYQTIPQCNFFTFLEGLLKRNEDMIFFAIGPNKEESEWKILGEKYPKQLHVMGRLDKYKVDEILSITDLYVDSFPVASYTACLDAAVKGINVVSLKTEEAFLDSLKNRAKTEDDLINLIEGILDRSIKYKPDNLQIHLKEGWVNGLEEIYNLHPQHKIHNCKSKVQFDNRAKGLMSVLDQNSSKYISIPTSHGEPPMYDLDEKGYVLPGEIDVWRSLFSNIDMKPSK